MNDLKQDCYFIKEATEENNIDGLVNLLAEYRDSKRTANARIKEIRYELIKLENELDDLTLGSDNDYDVSGRILRKIGELVVKKG